uniref:Beta-propeller fold protein n=1 Tax=Marseillevirus LCMAC201 TaxID=2506605 RepID=A0A481YWB4_9VIRU|nr:MAG: beta-propeller fold protein [Marseillevirus LCMAC201]
MLHVSFNQDSTCFACGKENGFVVYNCDPPTERFNRLSQDQSEPNGIGIVGMLFRSNIFAIVGGGRNPKYSHNTLMIWDDFQTKCIAELEFKTPVTGVKLRRDIILVTIIDKAYLYNFSNLKLVKSYDTYPNPNGISTITTGENTLSAFPHNTLGSVIVDNRSINTQTIIPAHSNALSALALNNNGDQLATASERGTIIRIWNTTTGDKLHELRRGLEVVSITSLIFDSDTSRLAVCSDKGTAHIFSLLCDIEKVNRKSSLLYISSYLPAYFSSEWSLVSFLVPPNSICTFSNNSVDTVYVIADGKFLKYTYNTETLNAKCIEAIMIDSLK